MRKLVLFLIIVGCLIFLLFTLKPRRQTFRDRAIKKVERDDQVGAMNNYLLASRTGDIESLFEVAAIYRFGQGLDESLKNSEKAKLVYLFIAKNGNSRQRAKANMFLEDLRDEVRADARGADARVADARGADARGADLAELTRRNRQAYLSRINSRDVHLNSLRRQRKKRPTQRNLERREVVNGFDYELEAAILENLRDNLRNNIAVIRTEVAETAAPRIYNDKQNVHESMVVRSAKAGLEQISNPNNLTENMREIETILRAKRDERAIRTFEKMMSNTENISAFNKLETEILNDVWNRIKDPVNVDRKADMTEILCSQLADGSEVCSMGRATRVLQTLEGTDKADIVKIRPEWALKEEIGTISAKMYSDLVASLPPERRVLTETLEEDLTPEDREKFNEIKRGYEKDLRDRLDKDYQNILSKEYLNVEVEKALAAV